MVRAVWTPDCVLWPDDSGSTLLISIPAGMSHMPFWKFMFYSGLGTVIWTTFLACVGFILVKPGIDAQNLQSGQLCDYCDCRDHRGLGFIP